MNTHAHTSHDTHTTQPEHRKTQGRHSLHTETIHPFFVDLILFCCCFFVRNKQIICQQKMQSSTHGQRHRHRHRHRDTDSTLLVLVLFLFTLLFVSLSYLLLFITLLLFLLNFSVLLHFSPLPVSSRSYHKEKRSEERNEDRRDEKTVEKS